MINADASSPLPAIFPPRRPGRRRRIFLFTSAGLLALLLLAAGCFVVWLRSVTRAALPQLDGEIHLAGLSAPVTVRRDAHGVPHIDAATQPDLFFAQGYITAQDRLWQMDALRRNANGELAEVAGPAQLAHDKAQRVLQVRRTAERIYAHLSPNDRARLDEYAGGVNLYIAQLQNSLPPEFRLMHYRPRPWNGADSISVGLVMVQVLDTHFDDKLTRDRISAKLNNEKLEKDLYPVGSWRDHPPTGIQLDLSQPHPQPPSPPAEDDEDDDRSQALVLPQKHSTVSLLNEPSPAAAEDLAALRAALGLPACQGCAPGSNNWVVAGRHTASGKPLLSNDMHLALTVPILWHMVDLSAPGYHVAGVAMPGVPGVLAGHNEHIAWGITALYADVQDLYIEKLDGKGNYQDLNAQWKPLTVDHEVIHVRGGKDVVVDVQSTAHGPLLNPILPKESRPIALKWTLYDPTLNAMPIYEIDTASNWTEFSAALGAWCWPTLNLVYSDDQGHIGYHAVGRVPIRGGGIGLSDVPLPHDVKNPLSYWGYTVCAGICPVYIPFDWMPNAFDPLSGFLATANSRVTTDDAPFPLSNDWIDPYRTERIYKLLQGRDGLTAADMLAVQTDIYSEVDQEMGHRFAYAIDHTPGADARLRQAANLMRSWDGRLTVDSPAASLVTQTRGALWPMILEPKLGKEIAGTYTWASKNFAEEEIVMHGNPAWLPPGVKNWDALLTAAVRRGMKDGKAPYNLARWNYGSWHTIDLEHPLSRFLPLIGRIASTGVQPLSGDTNTVKQVGREFGPSQRFTMDWSNIDGSTENIALGESGNPLSPYFRDQWNEWYNGTTFALPFTPAAVTAQTLHTLRLVP
jgi:penicillin amidase